MKGGHTHLSGVRLRAESNAVLQQFVFEQQLELEFGYPDQFGLALLVLVVVDLLQLLRTAARRMARTGGAGGNGRQLFGDRVLALLLDGGRLFQRKVHAGCALLAQCAHRLQQSVTVRRIEHANGVQVGVAHLLAYLQVVVAVVQE